MDPVTVTITALGALAKWYSVFQNSEQKKILEEQQEILESLPAEQKARFADFFEKQNKVLVEQQEEQKKFIHELQEQLEKLLGEHQDEQKRLRRHIWGFGVFIISNLVLIISILGVLIALHLYNVHL